VPRRDVRRAAGCWTCQTSSSYTCSKRWLDGFLHSLGHRHRLRIHPGLEAVNVVEDVFFGGARKNRFVALLPKPARELATRFALKRCIARWRGFVYATKVQELMGASSAYDIEQQLHEIQQAKRPAKARETFDPQKRPRVFDRLLRIGEPDIHNALTKKTPNGKFCSLVPDPDGELKTILDEPIWRLLDPTPLSAREIDAIERRLAGRRKRKPLPAPETGNWWNRCQALMAYEWLPEHGALPDAGLVALSDVLLEIHRARHSRNYARYIIATLAAADMTYLARMTILDIDEMTSVPGFEDFSLHEYICWAFGTVMLPGSSDGDWKAAREELYRDGIVFRKVGEYGDLCYYEAVVFFGVESPNKSASVLGWDTLSRDEGVEEEGNGYAQVAEGMHSE
jgi:hypothetical protein